jgi:hypothetical protein
MENKTFENVRHSFNHTNIRGKDIFVEIPTNKDLYSKSSYHFLRFYFENSL